MEKNRKKSKRFENLDTDNDGVISEEEFAAASKGKGVDKEDLNWFLRLITLGDKFSYADFFDRTKKGFVEFLIVFFGVLVSFGVEQKGEDFEDREWNIENLRNLKREMDSIKVYTNDYLGMQEYIIEKYQGIYNKWDDPGPNIFVEVYGPGDYEYPLKQYTNRNPFNPPRVVYEAIKLDGTFRFLGSEIGRMVNNTYDGTDLKYLMINTDKEDEIFTSNFNTRVSNKWVFELDNVDFDSPQFWVNNQKYILDDQYVKYGLFKRIELWQQIVEQLKGYINTIDASINRINEEIEIKDGEFTIVYWVF
jgi:hypothetical protein